MTFVALVMFTTLTIALAIGIWQMSKMDDVLPEDTSHLHPERKLQTMDRAQGDDVRGTKKDPLEA